MPAPTCLVQFHLRDGTPAQSGPCIGAGRDGAGHPRPFSYAVLVEPLGAGREDSCPSAVQTILSCLEGRRGGITAALQRGAAQVHETLAQQWGSRSPAPGGLGLALAALREGELYLALAGPTLALVIRPEGVETLSAAPLGSQGTPLALGVGRAPPLRLFRRELDPDAIVLLAFSPLRGAVAPDALAAAATRGAEAVMALVSRGMAPADDFAAAALALDDPAPAPAPKATAGAQPESGGPSEAQAPALAVMPPESLGLELHPPRRISSRRAQGLTISPAAAVTVAAAAAVLFLGVVLWYFQAQGASSREARHGALQQEARALYQTALAQPSRDAMRQKLLQARDSAEAATALRRNAPETVALLEAVRARLEELDAAVPLAETRVLVDLRLSAIGTSLRDLVLLGSDALVLDQEAGRIYRLPVGELSWRPEAPPALGPAPGAAPRGLRRLLGLPKGGPWKQDTLLALDEGRSLWEYRSRGNVAGGGSTGVTAAGEPEWRPVPLRGAAAWEALARLRGLNGNLYVLDPPSSQIWRYVPTDSGFDSERTGVLAAGSDLREAVDFALDGDLYVLLRSGKVLKFSGGRLQGFPLDGLDRRLSGPVALYASPEAQQVYVADNGNQRIVVLDKAGGFQRQILLPGSLPVLTDVLVDEGRGLLYLVTARQVVLAPLPR